MNPLSISIGTACLLIFLSFSVVLAEDFYQILGVNKQSTAREIRQAFKKIALVKHPDKNVENPNAHDEFLRINRAYEVLKDEDLRKKYDMHGEAGLKEDGPSGRGFHSWNFYKQDFGIYDDDVEIVTLSKSDFEQSVEGTDDIWFINFYSPQCSHCHTLAPSWREVARELEGVIRIGAINCGDDWQLCRAQGIHGYPSLRLYPSRENYMGERNTEELVKYGLRQVQARVHDLWNVNFENKMKEDDLAHRPWLITFCGDGGDCLEQGTSTKLAAMLNELANVGKVDCHSQPKICTRLGVEVGTFFFDKGQVTKGKGMEVTSLDAKEIAFTVLRQLPEVTVLKAEEFKEMLSSVEAGDSDAWLVHFVEGEVQDLELRKLPALLDELSVGRVDCRISRLECNKLHILKTPTFAVFKSGGGHEFHHGRLTAHDIAAFAKDSASTPVRVLGPKDFPKVVTGDRPWFIDFYAPWCPPCMRLLPEFRKASRDMVDRISFGTVDCTVHQGLCSQQHVQSYPTTIFYNQSQPHHFQGHHTKQALLEFLEDTLKPPVLKLDPDSFAKYVDNKAENEIWLVDFFAPWCGPCQQLAPEWRRLAKGFNGSPIVRVALVDCQAHKNLCQQNSVQSYPAVRLYPIGNGGARVFHVYNGWHRDAQSLRAWTFEYMPTHTTPLSWEVFSDKVLRSTEPWIVDFYTPWCGHCKVFAPEFERVASVFEGRVNAGKVNCDAHQWLCQQAGIRAYPSVRLYSGAKRQGIQQGIYGEDINSQDANQIIQMLDRKFPEKSHQRDEL